MQTWFNRIAVLVMTTASFAYAAPAPTTETKAAPATHPTATIRREVITLTDPPTTVTLPRGGVLMLDGRPATERAAFLGVAVANVSPELREQLKLQRGVGLVVNHVEAGSPAEAAGVKRFDVLERLDDQILVEPRQFAVLIRLHKAGDEVKLTLVRQAQPVTVTAKLAEKDLPSLEESRIPARTLPFPKGKGGDPFTYVPAATIKPGQLGVAWSDGELNIDLLQDHGRRIVARNKAGDVLFEGAIDTPEELQKIPEMLKAKALKVLHFTTTQPATWTTTQPTTLPLEFRSPLKKFQVAPRSPAGQPETM
jgi:hypothetical protein